MPAPPLRQHFGSGRVPHCDVLIEGVTLIPLAFAAPVGNAATAGRFVEAQPGTTATRRLNLAGHLAIPGLINTHLHAALVKVRGTAEDMGFAPSSMKGVPQPQNLERVRDLAGRHGLRLQTHLCQRPAGLSRIAEREGCTPVELFARLGPSPHEIIYFLQLLAG